MPPRQSTRLRSKRPAEDAPPSVSSAKIARKAGPTASISPTFSWPGTIWALALPFDVITVVIEQLDVPDIILLSMACRCTYIELNTRAFWLVILNRILRSRPVAPHSFDLSNMPVSQIRALCTNEVRFEREIRRRHPQASLALEFGDIAPDQVFELMPEGHGADEMKTFLLPGGRWAIGYVSNRELGDHKDLKSTVESTGSETTSLSMQRGLHCWDTAQLEDKKRWGRSKSRRLTPVATYLASELQDDAVTSGYGDPEHYVAFQLDPVLNVVNIVLGYQPLNTPAERVVEVVQLSWSSDGRPAFQLVATYRTMAFSGEDEDNDLRGPYVDGDVVLLYSSALLIIWDWRHGTHASLANPLEGSLSPPNLRSNRFFASNLPKQPYRMSIFEFQPDSLSPVSAPPVQLTLAEQHVQVDKIRNPFGPPLMPINAADDLGCYVSDWVPGSNKRDHLITYLSLDEHHNHRRLVMSISPLEQTARVVAATGSSVPSPFLALPDQTILFLKGTRTRAEGSAFSHTPRVSIPAPNFLQILPQIEALSTVTTKEAHLVTQVALGATTKIPKAGLEARFFCPMSGKLAAAFPSQDAKYAFVPFVGVR